MGKKVAKVEFYQHIYQLLWFDTTRKFVQFLEIFRIKLSHEKLIHSVGLSDFAWAVTNARARRSCITKAGVDVGHRLVHGHVYETSAEAVMRKDEQR